MILEVNNSGNKSKRMLNCTALISFSQRLKFDAQKNKQLKNFRNMEENSHQIYYLKEKNCNKECVEFFLEERTRERKHETRYPVLQIPCKRPMENQKLNVQCTMLHGAVHHGKCV